MQLGQVCDHHYCAATRTKGEPQSKAGSASITWSNPEYVLETIRLCLDSIVGLVTTLGTEQPKYRGSVSSTDKRFPPPLPPNAQIGSGASSRPEFHLVRGALSQTVKQMVREADQSPPI